MTEITLYCLILGDPLYMAFPVDIMDNKTIGHLKKLIVDEQRGVAPFDHIRPAVLRLFKVAIPIEDGGKGTEDTLTALFDDLALNEKAPLPAIAELAELFQVVQKRHIHILVKLPDGDTNSLNHPPATRFGVGTSRTAFLQIRKPEAPSSAGKPSEFGKHQKKIDEMIPCGRPYGAAATIPVTLLHSVFGQFKDDCESLTPTKKDNALTLQLQKVMSNFYESELERATTVRDELRDDGIILTCTSIEGTNFRTDGDTLSANGIYRFNLAEFKVEVAASKGAEPYLQACHYYLESTRNYASRMPHSVLPCIVLLVFGPHMYFAGAAWNGDRPNVQVLSPAISFHMHHSDTSLRSMAARHIGAYRKAYHSLKDYYEVELPSIDPSTVPPERVLFPYPTEFTTLNGTKQSFDYVSQVDPAKLLFFGRLRDRGDDICIKFCHSYSKEVHAFCASLDIAPRLLGFNKIPGSWYMVIMDRLDKDYSSYDNFEISPNFDTTRAALLHRAIWKGLKAIHTKGYVHGDIRNVNIMVANNGEAKFRIVDFDWAGKEGMARYPMNVYIGATLWRPNGAYDGELITVEHDEKMMERMIASN